MSLLKILTAQNHTLFYKIILFTEKNKNISPSYFIPNIFIKFYNNSCVKHSGFLWENNNRRGRTRPARSGNSIFYIYFVITQKNYAVLYTIIQFT